MTQADHLQAFVVADDVVLVVVVVVVVVVVANALRLIIESCIFIPCKARLLQRLRLITCELWLLLLMMMMLILILLIMLFLLFAVVASALMLILETNDSKARSIKVTPTARKRITT